MAPGRRVLKRESTVAYGGLATPSTSFYTGSSSSVSPKREIESIDLSFSDCEEEPPTLRSHHGLPTDEGYSSIPDRARRSASVSARTSRLSPSHTYHPSNHHSNQAEMDPPPPSQGLEFVGRNVKVLVDAISDLQKYGLEHVVSLPELVLVGDQSAGKSSLMSALTEVQLPRDQGICTKCPANIKTSPADEWSCKVSLQQSYRYDNPRGRIINSSSVNKKNPFPPWIEQSLEVKEFITVDDKAKLEEAIKWAQIALLNHDEDFTAFIPGVGHRTKNGFQHEREVATAKFSPNLIAIEISGPGLPALSFYDLPGVFRVAPDQRDQYLAKVIENLAIKYIYRPNALIIWTLAMKTDPSNSSTGKVIQDCFATDRTVGVLTNPDHVRTRHMEYERILQGGAHRVKHGYFVTKQPGDGALIPEGPNYHAIARHQEMEFFNSEKLWREEWKEFLPRCGTTAIQQFLSLELAKQIKDSIPRLTLQIDARTREVDAKLRLYPDLPDSDRRPMIVDVLSKFSRDVVAAMKGETIGSENRTPSFRSDWTRLSEQFSNLLAHIKPKIATTHSSERDFRGEKEVVSLLSDNEDEDEDPIVHNRKRKMAFTGSPLASKRPRADASSPAPHTPGSVKRENGDTRTPSVVSQTPRKAASLQGPGPFAGTVFASFSSLGSGFLSVTELQDEIQRYACPGLPGVIDTRTYDELCLRSIKIWREPLEVFMERTISLVRTQLEGILNDYLHVHMQTDLPSTTKRLLGNFIDSHASQLRLSLEEAYYLESQNAFTVNKAFLQYNKAEEYKGLREGRRNILANREVQYQMRIDPKKRISKELSQEEKQKIVEKRAAEIKDDEVFLKKLDRFASELDLAAYVRSYYITASQRFVDNVCLMISGKFFKGIKESITNHLEEKIGVNSPQGEQICRSLLKEDDTSDRMRRALKAEKEKLAGFSARLERLVNQLQNPDQDETVSDVADADADESYAQSDYHIASVTDIEMGDGSDETIEAFPVDSQPPMI
ncbi:hypothetical protein EG329_011365 [Mollisiaceae sp. DMI_Dod_QoI]|nr:hypothetical protein EG329_011365 [Helotiales sp. DMI_Dod_QoI]